jgi:muconolactone delta-isomerase
MLLDWESARPQKETMMKFMVTGHQTAAATEHRSQLNYLESSKEWVQRLKQEKKLDGAYSFPDGGGLFIIDAASHEELTSILLSFPLSHLSKFSVQPLADFAATSDIIIEAMSGITDMRHHIFCP